MEEIRIHSRAFKHGLSKDEITFVWHNFARKRPRHDDCWVAIGFTASAREVEMVGMALIDGSMLIIHALSPATERTRRELGLRGR